MEVKNNGESEVLDDNTQRLDQSIGQFENVDTLIDSEQEFEGFLSNQFASVETQLEAGHFANFSEFEVHLWEIKQNWVLEAPGCNNRANRIYNRYLELLQSGAMHFIDDWIISKPNTQDDDQLKELRSSLIDYKTKIDILEQNLKDKQFENDEITDKNKTLTKSFEQKEKSLLEEIQAISDSLENEKDKVCDLERQIEEFKCTVNWETSKRQQIESDLDSSTMHSDKLMSQMKSQIEQLESQLKSKSSQDTNEYIDILKGINEDLEAQLHEALEEHKLVKIQFEKELAVKAQKCQFFEAELAEAKSHQEQSENLYKNLMTAFENGDCWGRSKNLNNSIEEMIEEQRNIQNEELKELKAEYESAKEKLVKEIDELHKKNNEIELELKVKTSELLKENEQLKSQNVELLDEKESLTISIKKQENQQLELIENLRKHYTGKIESLESDLSQKEKQLQEGIQEVQEAKEADLAHLKQYYDEEKERLETRIQQERKDHKEKMKQQQEEHEAQLKEEQEFHEEEVSMMEEQIKQLEVACNEGNQHLEQEFTLQKQKIEYLESNLKDAKAALLEYQQSSRAQLDQQILNFGLERKDLLDKITALNIELASRDKNISIFENKNESALAQNKNLEEQIAILKENLVNDREDLKQKIIELNQEIDKLHDLNQLQIDEMNNQKLEFAKEQAMIKQKVEFKDDKILELTQTHSEAVAQYEERIRNLKESHWLAIQSLKAEIMNDLQNQVNILESEKKKFEIKLEEKREQNKSLESELHKLKAEKDRESIIKDQKIDNLSKKAESLDLTNKKLTEKIEKDMQSLKEDYESKLESLDVEIQELDKENNDLKTRLLDAERDYSEISSNYERDRALWEDKFDFLENQKQQAKRDLQDAHKKFEMTVEQLRRKDTSDRGKTESAQMLLIGSIEKKYKDQIKDIAESHQSIVNELNDKCKQLEKDYKDISYKYEIETRGKISDYDNMKHKIKELIENDKKLRAEIKTLKHEREQKWLEYQTIVEREKDLYKQHIEEIEKKAKLSESKRSELIFLLEKERANWSLEKDKLTNEIDILSEQVSKNKKKKDTLIKENEKLKNDVRNHKKFMHSNTIMPNYSSGVLASKRNGYDRIGTTKEPLTESGYNGKVDMKSPKEVRYIADYISLKANKHRGSQDRY